MNTQKKSLIEQIFSSNAGTNNVLIMALMLALSVFGVDEESALAIGGALTSVVMLIGEIIQGNRKARWSGNVKVYVLSLLVFLFPAMENIWSPLADVIDYLFRDDGVAWGGIIGLIIPLVNEIVFFFQSRNKEIPA